MSSCLNRMAKRLSGSAVADAGGSAVADAASPRCSAVRLRLTGQGFDSLGGSAAVYGKLFNLANCSFAGGSSDRKSGIRVTSRGSEG